MINFWLGHSWLCLAASEGGQSKNYLKVTSPFKNKERFTIGIVHLCIYIYSFYRFLVNLFCVIINYLRDKSMLNWKPEAEFKDSSCSSIANLTFNQEEDRLRFIYIHKLTDLLRHPGQSYLIVTSHVPILISVAGITVVASYYYNAIFRCLTGQIRADMLAFLCDPNGERLRIRAEIKSIFDSLLNSLKFNVIDSSLRFEHDEKSKRMYLKLSGLSSPEIDKLIAKESFSNENSIKQSYLKINKKMLLRLRSSQKFMILPANLTDSYLEVLSKKTKFYLIFNFISILVCSCLIILLLALVEVHSRTELRLNWLNCVNSRDHKLSGLMILDHLTNLNSTDYEIYRKYLKNEASYSELILIELKVFLDNRNIELIIKHALENLNISIFATFYSTLHFLCHKDRIVWLDQILAQIEKCINEIKRLKESDDFQNEGFYETKRNRLLFQNITIAYINFELFRRSQYKFRKLSSLFISQGVVFGATTMAFVYWNCTNLENSQIIGLAACAYMYVIGNYYLVFGAMMTSRIDRIRKSILLLLAVCKNTSFQNNYLIDLWSRQVTSPSETRDLLASHHLNIYLSWDRLITINAYFVGLGLTIR